MDYDRGESVFLHFSEVAAGEICQLMEGAKLEFDIGFGEKGMFARRAKVLSATQSSPESTVG